MFFGIRILRIIRIIRQIRIPTEKIFAFLSKSTKVMRIGIIGIGAMGSLFAARLNAWAEVVMLGSWTAQLQALRQNGLALIDRDGRRQTQKIRVENEAGKTGDVDVALILVKSYKTDQAAALAKSILSPNGFALTLQNGLGNWEKIAAAVGRQRTILGSTAQAATMIAPGVVRHAGEGPTYLGRPSSPRLFFTELIALFHHAGLETHLADDMDSLVWSKLVINAGINPLTALLRVPNGFLVENSPARSLMMRAAEEVGQVARARGVKLAYPNAAQRTLEVARATADNQSSMLQDVLRGAPTEIEAITGTIVDYGQRLGVPTPVNALLLRLVRAGAAKVDVAELQQLLKG
jgi:2-dehydropantoate 2-reductase